MVTLLHAMRKRGKSLGLATLCGGGGVSMAAVLETL
jgi:acetyl-CoA C-acetyltransferase